MKTLEFAIERWETILGLTIDHFEIVLTAMLISIALGVLVGILITYNKTAAKIVLNIANVMMTIPSLALFSILIPVLGIGRAPAIAGLVLYTQLPIIRNVYTGIMNIEPSIIESARGMGLTKSKIMFKVKLPLAFPVIMTGVRTATVMGIGLGAIAAYIGAGGLGQYIFQGINRGNDKMILIGAIMVSLITVVIDRGLAFVQRKFEI
ncbi:MAG: ABC transporter permease [Clostridia bacterium]|nr:ABC transporter permease [Clostridia bacterium]